MVAKTVRAEASKEQTAASLASLVDVLLVEKEDTHHTYAHNDE